MADASLAEEKPLLGKQRQPDEEQSLSELQQNVFKAQRAYMRAWSRTTSGKWHKCIMASVTALVLLFFLFCFGVIILNIIEDDGEWQAPRKVPLEAHIMSKCPDAKDCLHDMILPVMQNTSQKVDFKLSYIGQATGHDDGVSCMHGQEECLGNIIELCAAHLYPNPRIYLGFTMCLTHQYEDIPKRSLVEDCALEHGVSMEKLNECTVKDDGSLSVDMLRSSFERSANANVSKSCTVRLNGKVRCIRDSGEWSDCEAGSKAEDLIADIEELYYKSHDISH